MFRMKVVGAFAALGMLAGCASFSDMNDVDDLRGMDAVGGTPFNQALFSEYKELTLFEADQMYDWPDAGLFARKAMAAANNDVVLPEELGNWDLPDESIGELTAARARLTSALDATARVQAPMEAAHAQGRFDCWVEQQEENHQPDHIAACREGFYAAMEALEAAMQSEPAPMGAPEPYIVFFSFDSAQIDAGGMGIVDDAVAAAQQMGIIDFSVTGHADRAGAEAYNLALSLRRANAVRDALVARGILSQNISVAGRGEAEPAVPTPDGVREPANRRVEIVIQ
ncbi:OmpA family protein [Algihabitans albus]|uniref:OmpA family protein n=1 Tax=Algihabitans albus TaxID=2164067 RepID=UPI000E5D8220|nr:OmpA family protein [Algihabitans albus]